MTQPYEDPTASPTKRGGGCVKWGAILGSAFLIFMGLVSACGPDTVESEVPGPTVTQTVTQTTTATPPPKTVTETTTVTSESTTEEPVQQEVNPAAVNEEQAPADNVDVPQRVASIPDPEPAPAPPPAPAPEPAPIGRTITGGAFCKNVEIGQVGYTTAGTALTCSKAAGDPRARWR